MPRVRRIVQNVLSNWVSLVVTTIVGFFLSPFVVHHLGNLVYGVWVLIGSLVSYMSVLDLGLRGAVTRYVSKGVAQEDYAAANRVISGALWIRMWISLTVLFAGLILAAAFPHIFTIPGALQQNARLAVIIITAGVSITLWCGVFGGVLIAHHRYDVTSAVTILQTCLRAGGILLLLRSGHGILALAIWEFVVAVTASASLVILCFRIYPQLRIAFRCPDRATLDKIFTYSVYVFLINLASQITYYTDNVVVGAFLSPAAVTFYAVGGVLISYARQIVRAMTTTFTPLASAYEARGNYHNLRQLLTHGTRAALILSLPVSAGLFFRGHTFIRLWMGEQYAETSGTVMQILLLSVIFSCANTTSGGLVYGMEKHKRIALWAVGEGAANLILSVALVRSIGIYGVAWGTSIPSVIVEIILWPRYISSLLGIPVRSYLWETWCRTALAIIPFALGCWIVEKLWTASSLFIFFVQMSLLLPLIPGALFLVFRRELVSQAQEWISRKQASRQVFHGYKDSSVTVG